MKQIIFIFMSLLCFSCSSKAQNQTADTNVQSDKKILVAYFSCTGTTEKAADAIAKTVGGKLYQITPATAYTSADLDWNNKSSRSSIEMTTENSRPELGGEALATLTERECEIIKMFFGIGCQEMTLEEIGDKFGLTRERVRQIKEKAIRRLRQGTRSKLLKSYLG